MPREKTGPEEQKLQYELGMRHPSAITAWPEGSLESDCPQCRYELTYRGSLHRELLPDRIVLRMQSGGGRIPVKDTTLRKWNRQLLLLDKIMGQGLDPPSTSREYADVELSRELGSMRRAGLIKETK